MRVAERKTQGSVLRPPKPLRLTHFVVLASAPAVLTRVPSMALSGAAPTLPRMPVLERICPAAVSPFPARIFRRAVVIQHPPAAAGANSQAEQRGNRGLRRTVAQIATPFLAALADHRHELLAGAGARGLKGWAQLLCPRSTASDFSRSADFYIFVASNSPRCLSS